MTHNMGWLDNENIALPMREDVLHASTKVMWPFLKCG